MGKARGLDKLSNPYPGEKNLAISTGFNFAPAWGAIRIADNNPPSNSGGGNVLTISELGPNDSELYANYIKSIGDETYKGKFRLNLFGFGVGSSVELYPLNSSFYTGCFIDDLPAAQGTGVGRYIGSRCTSANLVNNTNGAVGVIPDMWYIYEPLEDNALIVHVISWADALNNTHLPEPFEAPLTNALFSPEKCQACYGITLSGAQKDWRTSGNSGQVRIGVTCTVDRGWQATLRLNELYSTATDSSVNRVYFLHTPYTGLYIPVKEHGSGYRTGFLATPLNSGLAYGAKQFEDTDRVITGGTPAEYPSYVNVGGASDSLNLASSALETSGGITSRLPAHGIGKPLFRVSTIIPSANGAGGATADFTATAGDIDSDVTVTNPTQIVEGGLYQITEFGDGEDYSAVIPGLTAVAATEGLIFKATDGTGTTVNGTAIGAVPVGGELLKKGIVYVDTGLGYQSGLDNLTIKGNSDLVKQGGTPVDGETYVVTSDGANADYSFFDAGVVGTDGYLEGTVFTVSNGGAAVMDGSAGKGDGADVIASLEQTSNQGGRTPVSYLFQNPTAADINRLGDILVTTSSTTTSDIGTRRTTTAIGFQDIFSEDDSTLSIPNTGETYVVTADGVGGDYSAFGGPASAILDESFVCANPLQLPLDSTSGVSGQGEGSVVKAKLSRFTARVGGRSGEVPPGQGPVVKIGITNFIVDDILVEQADYLFAGGQNGIAVADGDVFTITGIGNVEFTAHRFIEILETIPVSPSLGSGITINVRPNLAGEIIEFDTAANGSGYVAGDKIIIEGGHGSASLEIVNGQTALDVEYVESADGGTATGSGMTVDIIVDNEVGAGLGAWKDGSPATIGGVENIIVNNPGTGYKSGDILKITIGNQDCIFGLCFPPEFEGGEALPDNRNTVSMNPKNTWDRLWIRHWRATSAPSGQEDDTKYYKFRMANSQRNVVDMSAKGLPFDIDQGYEIDKVFTMSHIGTAKYCDLNIWEYDNDAIIGVNGFNDRFDPEALISNVLLIDDFEAHARVMPMFDKANALDENPDQSTIREWVTGSGGGDWIEPVTGSNGIVFDVTTDGRASTFARSGIEEFGFEIDYDRVLIEGDLAAINGTFEVLAETDYSNLGLAPGLIAVGTVITAAVKATLLGASSGLPAQSLRQVRTFEAIAAQSGYAADEILGMYFGASQVTDPDGEIMEFVMRKGDGDAGTSIVEERLSAGDQSAVGAFWGQGNADFDGKGWDPTDGDDSSTSMRLAAKRQVPTP